MNLKILIGVLVVMVVAGGNMNKQQYEWVSASTLAKRLGVSTTTIYGRIKKGVYKTQTFNRGKMSGYLIRVDNGKD